jgi:hypothetical protein
VKKYLLILLAFSFLANAVLPGFALNDIRTPNQTIAKELSNILGDKVFICTNINEQKFYLSSFERLEQEQKQKLKKQIDIAAHYPTGSDTKYINDVYSAYIKAIHRGAVKPLEIALRNEDSPSFYKASRAPPLHS